MDGNPRRRRSSSPGRPPGRPPARPAGRAGNAPGSQPSPFLILVDTREKTPFSFAGLQADVRDGGGLIEVLQERRGLSAGDYSLDGWEKQVAIERKSLADLYGTLGQGRDRFERELERLTAMEWAGVVIEAGWAEILGSPPRHSRLPPKTIHRSIIAWCQRFKNIHWFAMDNRRLAEITTYRLLERFWRDHQPRKSDDARNSRTPEPDHSPPPAAEQP